MANLVNAGILPFTFANEADYDRIDQMDQLVLADIRTAMENNTPVVLKNLTKNEEYPWTPATCLPVSAPCCCAAVCWTTPERAMNKQFYRLENRYD